MLRRIGMSSHPSTVGSWQIYRPWSIVYCPMEDTNNAALQEEMKDLSAADVYRRLSAAYDRMAAILDSVSDADLAELGEAPWGGQISRLDLLESSYGHDAEHVAEIAAARGAAT